MPYGRLQIAALAGNIGTPASEATIRVMPRGDHSRILEELITDSSGQTPTIELAAPPVEFSMQPMGEVPYSEYDVLAMADGYESKMIEGVQIMPDSAAYQDITLSPLTGYQSQPDSILINEHTLVGVFPPKIPEEEVKDLPESTGYVVLPDPVIPEFIIVHDGRPENASAPNYWVPFTDYIKNVASCEIYSTWPEATITANILAILSFTLNRVYTEWYRGKGYNFTITSSTAFDHAFSYGRNIFNEISVIVDNIFSTFITRPGIRQPLFTQYCDGRNVSCPNWMTQWGSKELGDNGYSAINILKHFYGSDIYLMQANKVAGIPSSYPGVVLQMGSVGQSVRTIQEQLNAISDHYPAIRKVRVDGTYGEETRASVEKFQEVFRLSADGMVGYDTWYKISNVYVAVTRLS